MNKILQKIEWRLRRVNLKFTLLDLYLHDGDACIGFSFCEIAKDYTVYSLLAFEFRLPNGADRKVLSISNWDFLFLNSLIWKWVSDADEREMWGSKLSKWDSFWYKTLSKLYR